MTTIDPRKQRAEMMHQLGTDQPLRLRLNTHTYPMQFVSCDLIRRLVTVSDGHGRKYVERWEDVTEVVEM